MELTSITGLKGEVSIPGDKSISHRSVMFASLANGMTEIHNFLSGADCLATIDCFRKMGIKIGTPKPDSGTRQGTARTDCAFGNITGKKQRNDYPPALRYSCRTAIFHFPFRRRVTQLTSHETDHRTTDTDGRSYFQPARQWMCTADH